MLRKEFLSRIFSGLLSGAVCLAMLGGGLPSNASPISNNVKVERLSVRKALTPASSIPHGEHSGLDAYNDTPLGDRTPLILIHGIGGDESRLFHWENFLAYTRTQPAFHEKYKIYLYHYDSSLSVPTVSRELQTTLKTFIRMTDNRKIKILAYSEGGLLARNALQDPYLDEHTREILTIATPFHGSPLANPEWIQAQVNTESALSPVRLGQKIAYKITRHKYPSFRQDFQWDNFDGAIPANLAASIPERPKYALASKANFVTYGSYFGKAVNSDTLLQTLELSSPPPRDRLMPSNLFRRNVLFSLVRNNIARLPLAIRAPHPEEKQTTPTSNSPPGKNDAPESALMLAVTQADSEKTIGPKPAPLSAASTSPALAASQRLALSPVSMMVFNDGISPISSTLWLGRYMPGANGAAVPIDRLWSALKSLKGNNRARLFAGLDHRNWMDGTTRGREPLIRDLLNPDEAPRTVFGWIIYDLMS